MTAINGCQFAAGQKNEFQGTGVWGWIKMDRKPKDGEGSSKMLADKPADCEVCDKAPRQEAKTRPDYRK